MLEELRGLGVRLSIDDFGTGYSSLAALAAHPFDILKIDRSFVAGLCTDPRHATLVAAIVGIAHSLGMTTVAEGVEDHMQLRALTDNGCDAVQGFLLSEPLEGDALERVAGGNDGAVTRIGGTGYVTRPCQGDDAQLDGRRLPRVVLIDDEPAEVGLLQYLLTNGGFDVTATSEVGAFLEAMADSRPDLVLMDVNMPARTGTELVGELRTRSHLAGVPIVAVTGYPAWVTDGCLGADGFSGVIRKPIEPGWFAAQLRTFLEEAAPAPGDRELCPTLPIRPNPA